jgi:glutamate racemase
MLHELGSSAEVVDSARATALVVSLGYQDSAKPAGGIGNATFECYATDSVEKFARLGGQFLGQSIPHVELLDLGG